MQRPVTFDLYDEKLPGRIDQWLGQIFLDERPTLRDIKLVLTALAAVEPYNDKKPATEG